MTRTMSAIVIQKGWLVYTRCSQVCSLIPTTSEISAWLVSAIGCVALRCTDGSRQKSGDFLRGRLGGCLVGDLGAAPENNDAVGNRENIGHAMTDQQDRHALASQTADEFQDFSHLAHRYRRRRLVHQHD